MADFINVSGGYGSQTTEIYLKRLMVGKGDRLRRVCQTPAFLGFLPFVWGDYNIIELAPDYSSALIGNLDRKGLWVLSRKPQLEEAIYQQLLDKAAAQGFDVSLVKKTKQTE